jgi:serine/threonine-protein kinase
VNDETQINDTKLSGVEGRSDESLRVGSVVGGRYEIQSLLGAGAMGTVYAAHDRELDEKVALKVLSSSLAASPGALNRFRTEVKLARRVTHGNVARTFELGEHGDLHFLTMEYVDGESLSSRVRQGPMSLDEAAPIVIAISAGLSAAHTAGVIHRDIKPDNILIARDGRVVISDFGIARTAESDGSAHSLTLTQGVVGTPAYMAPEQIQGGEITYRVDLYAFGVLLFQMLVGRLPFAGQTPMEMAIARLVEAPPDPREFVPIPDPIADLILRAMAREPKERPDSAIEFSAAFQLALSLDLPPPSAFGAPARPTTRAPSGGVKGLDQAMIIDQNLPATAAESRTAVSSLAVLPFRNAGPPEDDYLAFGLAEDLIDTLSSIRGLRVLSASAVAKLKRQDRDPMDAGRDLGVRFVVDGTLRRGGDALRLTTRLLDVGTGYQLAADRFDGTAAEMFGFQDQATQSIASALSIEAPAMAPGREAPEDPIALDLYLKARHAYHEVTHERVRESVELFNEALARAPDHPLISAGLAIAEARAWFMEARPQPDVPERVLASAERAVLRGPYLGESHLALGLARLNMGDAPGAARSLRAAISRSPSLAEAHDVLGRMLVEIGRVQDGLRRLRVALGLDRSIQTPLFELTRALVLFGEWNRALPLLAEIERMGGEVARIYVVRVHGWRGEIEKLERLEASRQSSDPVLRLMLDFHRGRVTKEHVYQVLESQFPGPGGSTRRRALFTQLKAEVAAMAGDGDTVVRELQRADSFGFLDLMWLERFWHLDPFRERPEFVRICDSVQRRADSVSEAVWGREQSSSRL